MLLHHKNIKTVDYWSNFASPTNVLANAFEYGIGNFFENIYIPVKKATVNGQPDDWTYTKIGYTSGEISTIYYQLYSQNYLAVNLIEDYLDLSATYLADKIAAIIALNKSKYLKMIELLGYAYNPLFNIDGVEDFSYLENSGTNDVTTTHEYDSYTDTGTNTIGAQTDQTTDRNTRSGGETRGKTEHHEDTNSVTTFDSTDLRTTSHNDGDIVTTNDNLTYNNVIDDAAGSITHGSRNDSNSTTHGEHTDIDSTTITHKNALNGQSEYYGDTDTFGNTIIGGDKYHTERKIRKGNIGVTKTQELIDAERQNLRWSILTEFFKDLNDLVLIGIYN